MIVSYLIVNKPLKLLKSIS